ncbi:MAG: polyprenyl diphosphate synthase [Nitrososphaerales archaeon]
MYQVKKGTMPKHIGIILDGNRRWADSKSLPKELGHIFGADNAERYLEWARELGINITTIYVLSTENLQRDKRELEALFKLIEERLEKLLEDERIYKYKVKVKGIGKVDLLPNRIRELLNKLEEATCEHEQYYLNIALAYGGRQEIVDGVKRIAKMVKEGLIQPEDIDQSIIEKNLYTSFLPSPEPDMIIRTSGEERLSGFLLWQSAYSELIFLDVFWPDFRKIDLMRAIRLYQKRVRRFGR